MNTKKISYSFLPFLIIMLFLFPHIDAEAATQLTATVDMSKIQKHGNVPLALSSDEIINAGYNYGDILNVSFLGQSLDLPLCSSYSDVDAKKSAVFARKADGLVQLGINMGDFATTYHIAEKTTNDDGTFTWNPSSGVTLPVTVTIDMKEAGGYYDQYMIHQLNYDDDRTAYPHLTDAQFANFRQVSTTGIAPGRLYRTSSPVNPARQRNKYADAAIRDAGVTVIMNLADSDKTFNSYEGLNDTYYSKQKYKLLNMSIDFTADEFRSKLAEGLRFFASNKGIYAIHCNEGKDRAGLVTAILECLMGASSDEVVNDYMTSFYNYYGITPGDAKYQTIANSNIKKTLAMLFDISDITTADLAAEATDYVRSIGLTNAEIAQLKSNLSEPISTTSTTSKDANTDTLNTTATSENPTIIYVVKPGDTLTSIAAEQLGDKNYWKQIYNSNKSSISDPNLIYIGQTLKIAG